MAQAESDGAAVCLIESAHSMGRRSHEHGYPRFCGYFYFSDFPTISLLYTPRLMKVPCRLPEELWNRVAALARAERRSGQAQLEVIVERGLEGLAAYELWLLTGQRTAKLMRDREKQG